LAGDLKENRRDGRDVPHLPKRFGKQRIGLQPFRCTTCGKTFTEPHEKPLDNMTIRVEKAQLVLRPIVEG